MDPVEESDDDQILDFAEYMGHIADGHGHPQMNDDMWDDVYNDYMGDDDEGVWGYNGSDAEDYLDDYFLDSDFYDSDDDPFNINEDYFTWEEDSPEIEDRYLTHWSGVVRPGQMTNDNMSDSTPANSIIGPSWERMKVARQRMSKAELRLNEQVSYEQLFVLAVQLEKMMAAWKKRMDKTGINWESSGESFQFTVHKQTNTCDVSEAEDSLGKLKLTGTKNEETEPDNVNHVIYKENMDASERVQYSVEKLLDVLGSSRQLDELCRKLNEVKNWVQKHIMESLNSYLPLSLPYPALAALFKTLYDIRSSTNEDVTPGLGFVHSTDPENLVEEKYLVRLYLSLADVYNVLREVMFRRPAVTCRKDFKEKFKFILSRIEPNLTFIKALHDQSPEDQSTNESNIPVALSPTTNKSNIPVAPSPSTNESNIPVALIPTTNKSNIPVAPSPSTNESSVPVAPSPTKQTLYCQNEMIFPVTDAALSNKFIVTICDKANPSNGQMQMKPHIKIFNTENNQIEKVLSLEIEPYSKELASKGLNFRSKTTVSVAQNLILYGVLFTTHGGDQFSDNVWRPLVENAVTEEISHVWRCIVVDWRVGQVIHDIIIVLKEMSIVDSCHSTIYPKLSLSKFETQVWILEETFVMTASSPKKCLKVFEGGIENPEAIYENSSIVSLKKNFLVISTDVDCDDEKLTCVKWINLLTQEVISEDLYRANKDPSICFDTSNDVKEESLKFVQVNDSGKAELWKIEPSGCKEILHSFEPEIEVTKFHRTGFDSLRYFHPYLLSVSNTEDITDDYRVLSSAKVTVQLLKENAPPRQVVFLNTSPDKLYGFHTFQYSGGVTNLHIDLDRNAIVTMTKQKKIIENVNNHDEKDISSKWSRFDFNKDESLVIAEDIKSAKNVLKEIESEKVVQVVVPDRIPEQNIVVHNSEVGEAKDQQSGACAWLNPSGWASNQTFKSKTLQDFSKTEQRIVGELIDWEGTSGYLQLHSLKNSPKIFLHVSNIRTPIPFLKTGIKFEVSITEDTNTPYYEAVKAVALN